MFFPKNLCLALLACCFFTSCTLFKKSSNTELSTPQEVLAEDSLVDLYRASATKVWELVHTGIDIRFNLQERSADGTAQITLHPYYYATDSIVLDAKAMNILEVRDAANQALSYSYDTATLKIRLPRWYQKQDTLRLNIRYKALPYAFTAGGSEAIGEDRGLYFVNTDGKEPYQPVQIWTQGETESNSHWFPTFDKTNFRSAFDITMHVPDSFKTLSNGLLVASVKEKNGWRADTWKQALPIPPYLAMMAAGNFAVARASWKGKEVSYYVPQEYSAYARDIFRYTPEMIDFYSGLLGIEFPWDKYSQVVVYNYVSGAMENVSASLFGAFNLKDKRQLADDNNDYIIAHELFHQWFGDYVTAESWSNLTLNESFADYGEYLWSEHRYGKVAMQNIWVQGLNKYLSQAQRKDPPLLRYHYYSREDMFDRVSYSKGGLILHYLRQLAGDDAFFDALHLYLQQNALHSAEVSQLRLALEQVTGKDWNWFFDEWYYRGGHPSLDVSYTYDDARQTLLVKVLQAQPDSVGLYRLPLKAQLICGDNISMLDWTIERKEETFRYPYQNGQRPVLVPDAGHWLPGAIKDRKNAAQWKAQYLHSGDYISKSLALSGMSLLKNNDTAEQVMLLALTDKDPLLRSKAVMLKTYESNKKGSSEAWIRALGKIADNDPEAQPRTNALAALGSLKDETYVSTYELAISDSSYKVAAAGLYALDQVNHKRAVEYARRLKPEAMMGNALLYQAAEIIAREGDPADYPFLEQKTLHLFENNRLAFLPSISKYLKQVKEEPVYRKGITFLKKLAIDNAGSTTGLYYGMVLLEQKTNADKELKVTTDRMVAEAEKNKRDIAILAWEAYKASISEESLKEEALKMEKE